MDTYPVTARSVAQIYKIDGRQLERAYKDCLSGFKDWDQVDHAAEWVLLPENMGDCLSIDETLLHEDLRTFVSNKAGHGKHGTLVASVSGTKASDVIKVLMQIPEEKRLAVKEVTMDFSDSMYTIATKAFPNAEIVVDCFHIIKRCTDAVEEVRLREKREAIKEQNKQKTEHRKNSRSVPNAASTTGRTIRRTTRARSVAVSRCDLISGSSPKNCPTVILM